MYKNNTPPQYVSPQQNPPQHFYFYDDIGDPVDYCDFIYTLDHASENEEIHIHLATGGGDMETAIVIVHALMRTNAHVIGHADGGVASAGTIILLSCHSMVISPFSHFLFHDGSLGTPRMKFSENLKQAQAVSDLYSKIAYSIYVPFFTEEEVGRILDGSDCYQTSEQMDNRIRLVFEKEEEVVVTE